MAQGCGRRFSAAENLCRRWRQAAGLLTLMPGGAYRRNACGER